jgi:hypothetical protein
MAMDKAVDGLKNGPKEDKVVVAGGIAVAVVVVLLAAWAIYFFQKIQRGAQAVDLSAGAQDDFNFKATREAQEQLKVEEASAYDQELLDIRSRQGGSGAQYQSDTSVDQGLDQFGGSN